MLVYLIKTRSFVVVDDEQGRQMIEEGKAQSAMTPAHLLRKPVERSPKTKRRKRVAGVE